MRGSFCQALPIGCMRVFMTPSCSSAVTLESRCSGALNSRLLVPAHDFEQLVAREHQLRHHRHQLFERIDSDPDRLIAGFASVVGLGRVGRRRLGGFAAGSSTAVSRNARSSSSSESSPGRNGRSSTCGVSVPTVLPASPARQRRDPLDHPLQIANQIVVGALRLALLALERFQNVLDAVDGRQDQRDCFAGRRHAVAKFAHQRFGGMRERFQPRQARESRRSP